VGEGSNPYFSIEPARPRVFGVDEHGSDAYDIRRTQAGPESLHQHLFSQAPTLVRSRHSQPTNKDARNRLPALAFDGTLGRDRRLNRGCRQAEVRDHTRAANGDVRARLPGLLIGQCPMDEIVVESRDSAVERADVVGHV
jgi:hypothetical protein